MTNLSHFNKNFNHLDISERKLIQKLHLDGFSVSNIANLLGRHRLFLLSILFYQTKIANISYLCNRN